MKLMQYELQVHFLTEQPQNQELVKSACSIFNLHNNMLAHSTVTKDDDDVGLHEYSC